MSRRLTYQGKALLLILLLFLLWWFLPALFKRATRVAFQEFQAPAWTALSYLHDLQDFWSHRLRPRHELIEAGIDLSRLNAAYALRNQRMEVMEGEILRLEAMLGLPSLPQHRYEVARVVRRELTNWWQYLVIRKGSLHGVAPGQAVVFAGGVVGRVRDVQPYTAVVQLVSSPDFRAAVHFGGDERPLEFVGGLNPTLGPALGTLRSVPADVRLHSERPLTIVSSRLGGVFPDGFFIGTVEHLELGTDGLFQTGRVRLNDRLLTVREVAVIIPLDGTTP
jgi:rod shape-determining protein MreC